MCAARSNICDNTIDYREWFKELLEKGQNIEIKQGVVKFTWNHMTIKFTYSSEKDITDILQLVKRNFIMKTYAVLNVNSKTVVDIGANIGDTAIYFAVSGAKHVYAFEPYRYAFLRAEQNININGIHNKVTLVNAGCTEGKSVIKIKENYKSGLGDMLKDMGDGNIVKTLTLAEIVDIYGIVDAVLKIDGYVYSFDLCDLCCKAVVDSCVSSIPVEKEQ